MVRINNASTYDPVTQSSNLTVAQPPTPSPWAGPAEPPAEVPVGSITRYEPPEGVLPAPPPTTEEIVGGLSRYEPPEGVLPAPPPSPEYLPATEPSSGGNRSGRPEEPTEEWNFASRVLTELEEFFGANGRPDGAWKGDLVAFLHQHEGLRNELLTRLGYDPKEMSGQDLSQALWKVVEGIDAAKDHAGSFSDKTNIADGEITVTDLEDALLHARDNPRSEPGPEAVPPEGEPREEVPPEDCGPTDDVPPEDEPGAVPPGSDRSDASDWEFTSAMMDAARAYFGKEDGKGLRKDDVVEFLMMNPDWRGQLLERLGMEEPLEGDVEALLSGLMDEVDQATDHPSSVSMVPNKDDGFITATDLEDAIMGRRDRMEDQSSQS